MSGNLLDAQAGIETSAAIAAAANAAAAIYSMLKRALKQSPPGGDLDVLHRGNLLDAQAGIET